MTAKNWTSVQLNRLSPGVYSILGQHKHYNHPIYLGSIIQLSRSRCRVTIVPSTGTILQKKKGASWETYHNLSLISKEVHYYLRTERRHWSTEFLARVKVQEENILFTSHRSGIIVIKANKLRLTRRTGSNVYHVYERSSGRFLAYIIKTSRTKTGWWVQLIERTGPKGKPAIKEVVFKTNTRKSCCDWIEKNLLTPTQERLF